MGQLVFRYGLIGKHAPILALNDWQYGLMVLATVLVAAGGFFANSAMSQELRMPEGKLYNIYGALTISGFAIGYYLSDQVQKPLLVAVFIIAAAVVYLYATSLKQVIVLSNIMVAAVAVLPLFIIALYNMYPILVEETRVTFKTLLELMLDYAVFIFSLVLLLTLLYNLRDINKDYNSGNTTLPIALGKDRAAKVAFFFTLIPLAMLLYYGNTHLLELVFALGYGIFFMAGPLIYCLIKLWTAKTPKDFHQLAQVVKVVIFFTILSVLVINYNIDLVINEL